MVLLASFGTGRSRFNSTLRCQIKIGVFFRTGNKIGRNRLKALLEREIVLKGRLNHEISCFSSLKIDLLATAALSLLLLSTRCR
jgi:hypothetical protein